MLEVDNVCCRMGSSAEIWSTLRTIANSFLPVSRDGVHPVRKALDWGVQLLLNMFCNKRIFHDNMTCCTHNLSQHLTYQISSILSQSGPSLSNISHNYSQSGPSLSNISHNYSQSAPSLSNIPSVKHIVTASYLCIIWYAIYITLFP